MEQVNTQSWLDYTIASNLTGVLKVLSSYGFSGMYAPQSIQDVQEDCFDLMKDYGDEGVIALLQAHPQYVVFKELFETEPIKAGTKRKSYHNSVSDLSSKMDSFVSKLSPIDRILVAAGVFIAMHYVLQETKKK